jgi:hypothetical protein
MTWTAVSAGHAGSNFPCLAKPKTISASFRRDASMASGRLPTSAEIRSQASSKAHRGPSTGLSGKKHPRLPTLPHLTSEGVAAALLGGRGQSSQGGKARGSVLESRWPPDPWLGRFWYANLGGRQFMADSHVLIRPDGQAGKHHGAH